MSNQTEAEFFAVATTGRKGLEDMASKMGGEIMALAAAPVRQAGQQWLQRAIVSVANNDNLKDVVATKQGLFSIYKAWAKAATMGLQLGGQFAQAHLTPYDGKAELIVSAEGYKHAAIHGPGAVLSDLIVRRVYEGDKVKLDAANATVEHDINPMFDRGKLVGVYGVVLLTNGRKELVYMSKSDALRIRDGHSRAYKNGKGPWKTDEDAMVEKTAVKSFLRPYAAEAEGLAMLYQNDTDEPAAFEPAPVVRDQGDRMGERLAKQAEKVDKGATKPAPAKAAEPAVTVEDTPTGNAGADPEPAELF